MNNIPERQQYSLILVGDFNPAMFHPEWFKRNDIISPEEIDFEHDSSLKNSIIGDDRKSGLTAIQMQKSKTDGTGQYTVILQPSNFVKPGIFMSCNDHTNMSKENNLADNVMENISNMYNKSLEFMQKVQIDLIDKVAK